MHFIEEEKKLIIRIKDGDLEAENLLFVQFQERIRFLVKVRLRKNVSLDDQDDIISEIRQAILLSLRKGSFDVEKENPLEAYIAGIVSNIVGQYFRKLKKEHPKVEIDSQHHLKASGNILSDLVDKEEKEKIRSCLIKLEHKYKEVLLLRIYEDKTIEEISEALNLEKRRVSERINYALKLFLKEYKKEKYFNI